MGSRTNHTVCAAEVHDLAGGILRHHLQLEDRGPKCTIRNLLLVLFFAAARAGSIFDACQRLRRAPTDQAVRNALVAQLPEVGELEQRLNRALAAQLPKGLGRRRHPMAIDLSEICYYGQPLKKKGELRRGKRKQGTSRFHGYATLCVLDHGQRYTVAMTYAWKEDSHAALVRRLLEQARRMGLNPRYVLLDRGFYGVPVVQYLQSVRCPFLMPVVHRGRKSRRPLKQLKSTRRFLAWRKSGFATHTMNNPKGLTTTVKICVRHRPRRGRRKLKTLVFAFWGIRPGSATWVAQTYRKRYGIETSYRQMNQARIRTCTRDPRMRLLLVGIALILRNVWVWLHHMVLGQVRKGRIELHPELLRMRTMLLLLQRCAEAWLECTESWQAPIGQTIALAHQL
jgi:Transposase DDE domain